MREIRPYGSEGGGGETLPTLINSRWLSEATPLVMRSKKKVTVQSRYWPNNCGAVNPDRNVEIAKYRYSST